MTLASDVKKRLEGDFEAGLLTVTPYQGLPALHFAHEGGEPELDGYWYRNFVYTEEQARGLVEFPELSRELQRQPGMVDSQRQGRQHSIAGRAIAVQLQECQ